jgi:hypothetical protein
VTRNLSDFPAAPLAEYGIAVADPDAYLCEMFNEFGDEVASTVVRLAGEKRDPPMSTADLLATSNGPAWDVSRHSCAP